MIKKMNRNERVLRAEKHDAIMRKYFGDKIKQCTQSAVIYDENKIFEKSESKFENTEIVLECLDSVTAVNKYADGKCAMLNFASFKHAGGGFITGAMAQEEAVCHESWLYEALDGEKINKYYENNKKNTNKSIYYNRAIYMKNIGFMNGEYDLEIPEKISFVECDVLTCAAPNRSAALRNGVTEKENDDALVKRIEFVLEIFAENKAETLILGAFGCGVFGQNAYRVTEIFCKFIENKFKGCFKKIIFAIPDEKSRNYNDCMKFLNNTDI